MTYKKHLTKLSIGIGGTQFEPPSGLKNVTPTTVGYLGGNLIQLAIKLMFVSAVILALFFMIWGGISWILSAGDPKAIETARTKITWAVIGLVVTFASFFILMLIGNFFGIDFFAASTTTVAPGAPM